MEQHWEDFNTPIPPPQPVVRSSLRKRSLWALISLIACGFIVVAGSILAFYFLPNPDFLFGEQKSAGSADKLLQVEFAGSEFAMPEPMVRSIKRSLTGKVRRIELRVPWPYSAEAIRQIEAEDLDNLSGSLFLTVEHNTKKLSAIAHLEKILQRYFTGKPTPMPSGLMRYQFKLDSPYPSRELYIGALRGKQIILHCEPSGPKNGPSLCARDVQVTKAILVRYRFHRKYLPQWRALDKKAKEVMRTFLIQ